MARLQCDQFRWFLQILGNKLSHKSCPNILVIFGLFLIITISFKKCVATFWAFLWGNLGNFLFHHLVTLLVCLAWPDKFDALYWSSVLESKISSDRLWDDSNEIKKSTLKGFFSFWQLQLSKLLSSSPKELWTTTIESPVWPDLAKFCHSGYFVKFSGNILKSLFKYFGWNFCILGKFYSSKLLIFKSLG